MKFGKHLIVLLLLSLFCIASASAAGTGVFSISNVGNVSVGQTGVATVSVNNNWNPNFGDTYVYVSFDPTAVEFVSSTVKVPSNTTDVTLVGSGKVQISLGDFKHGYPAGSYPLAELTFKQLKSGTNPMTVTIDHVRYWSSDLTTFTDITDSASAVSGVFSTGAVSASVIPGMNNTTAFLAANGTAVDYVIPNLTNVTVTPTYTIANITNVTTVATVNPNVTYVIPTPFTQSNYAGSDDYTGVGAKNATATKTPAVSVTLNATANATALNATINKTALNATANATALNATINKTVLNATANTSALNATVNTTAINATINKTASATNVTVQKTIVSNASNTSAPNATATQKSGMAGGLLSLVALGGVGLLLIARRNN
jgi:hypothetical protein